MNTAQLRLLFVATLPEPGGAAGNLADLVTGLVDAGHVVGVVADRSSDLWRTLDAHGGAALFPVSHAALSSRDRRHEVASAIATIRADGVLAVFECDYWDTGFASRRAGVPAAFFLHHAGMKRANRWLLPLSPWHVVVPSNDLRQWVTALGVGDSRVHVLRNAVDTAAFRADDALRARVREALGVSDRDVVVGFIGRIEANKGVVPLAHALNATMEHDGRVHALWVGCGRKEPDVDAIIAGSAARSRHHRTPWTASIRESYAAMDLLVLPSTRRESFGRVLIEAQACELPVVASEIGGIPEAVRAGSSAILVPPGDVAALSAAISALANDQGRREAMGAAGRAFVQAHFDRSMVEPEFVRWFTTWQTTWHGR